MGETTTIYWRNSADEATLTASSAALPVANLADWRPGKVWRTTSGTGQWAKASWIVPTPVDSLIIWKHNLSAAGTVRIRVYEDAGETTVLYDSGEIPAWPPLFGWGLGPYGLTGWGGYPSDEQIVDRNLRPAIVHSFGATYAARVVRLDVTDSVRSFIDVGRWFIGQGYRLAANPDLGMTIDFVDPSVKSRTDCGDLNIDRKPVYRQISLRWGYLESGDSVEFYDMAATVGSSLPFFIDVIPDEEALGKRLLMYAVPQSPGRLTAVTAECYSEEIVIEEVL